VKEHAPIVVGVDDSDAAPRAIAFAGELAAALEAPCRLVHAVRSPWASAPAPDGARGALMEAAAVDAARVHIRAALADQAPAALLDALEVRVGRTSVELAQAAAEAGAQLIVIGGKRHSTFGRWFGSSTGHGLARVADRPVLVAGPSTGPVRRVLAAVDFAAIVIILIAYAVPLATHLAMPRFGSPGVPQY
jgi:nucleotide-binding universal stress UspA family protein